MPKFRIIYLFVFFLIFTSFSQNADVSEVYELELNAGGCHYRISVNDKVISEGKSYQNIQKKIKINDELKAGEEQLIEVQMMRISREMPLKNTNGFIILKLNKINNKSVTLVKELKLPTFPYDDDEQQPQSIGGSIEFKIKKLVDENEFERSDSVKLKKQEINQ